MNITSENIDQYLFDYVEGNLSTEQQKEIEKYIHQNPSAEEDLELWKLSFVPNDDTIIFENKSFIEKNSNSNNIWKLGLLGIEIISFFTFLILLIPKLSGTSDDKMDTKYYSKRSKNSLILETNPLKEIKQLKKENFVITNVEKLDTLQKQEEVKQEKNISVSEKTKTTRKKNIFKESLQQIPKKEVKEPPINIPNNELQKTESLENKQDESNKQNQINENKTKPINSQESEKEQKKKKKKDKKSKDLIIIPIEDTGF